MRNVMPTPGMDQQVLQDNGRTRPSGPNQDARLDPPPRWQEVGNLVDQINAQKQQNVQERQLDAPDPVGVNTEKNLP